MTEPAPTPKPKRSSNRNTELGDRACFCAACGWARRFYPGVVEPPEQCPACAGVIVSACPSCGEDILSIMSVECDVCEAPLREPEVNGVRIHRPKRLPMARAAQAAPEVEAVSRTGMGRHEPGETC
ncbi:MAG: hypothetical protein JWN72_21 [Thermoleophilia bacterium]|nr:hypothetical protein [Thermoleophilia bacterium]